MSERERVETVLHKFLSTCLSDLGYGEIPLIFENENGVRPKPPFLSIGFGALSALGTIPFFEGKNRGGEESSFQPVERNVTIRGFGKRSEDILTELRELLQFDKYINILRKDKLSLREIDNMTESVNDYSSDYETFFQLDCVLSYTRKTTITNDWIERVEITTDVEGRGSETAVIGTMEELDNGRPDRQDS